MVNYIVRRKQTIEDIISGVAKKYKLYPLNYLDLYLVANDLVPATHLLIQNIDLRGSKSIGKLIMPNKEILAVKRSVYRVIKNRLGLYCTVTGVNIFDNLNMGKRKTHADMLFSISKNADNQYRHIHAKDDYEMGLMSGYPLEAILKYGKKFGEKRWEWFSVYAPLHKKISEDPYAHIEQAYLTWVPESADPNTGEIGSASKQKCIEYMNFVRAHNPELAASVEKCFVNKYKGGFYL